MLDSKSLSKTVGPAAALLLAPVMALSQAKPVEMAAAVPPVNPFGNSSLQVTAPRAAAALLNYSFKPSLHYNFKANTFKLDEFPAAAALVRPVAPASGSAPPKPEVVEEGNDTHKPSKAKKALSWTGRNILFR